MLLFCRLLFYIFFIPLCFFDLKQSLQEAADNFDPDTSTPFTPQRVFFNIVTSLFMVMLGDIDFDSFNATIYPDFRWLSSILLIMHILIITIMLLNLLIAMMGDTYAKVFSLSFSLSSFFL